MEPSRKGHGTSQYSRKLPAPFEADEAKRLILHGYFSGKEKCRTAIVKLNQ